MEGCIGLSGFGMRTIPAFCSQISDPFIHQRRIMLKNRTNRVDLVGLDGFEVCIDLSDRRTSTK